MPNLAGEHDPNVCSEFLTWLAVHGNEVLTEESARIVDDHWKEVHGR